jgi:hypothetical protein
MKNEDEKLKALFEKFEGQWDINNLDENHDDVFLDKLNRKKSKSKLWFPMGIAATILVSIGIFLFFDNNQKTSDLKFASNETRETDSVFNSIISTKLLEIKQSSSPENKIIIDDALLQMKTFDADYEIIKNELETNGENKQIIFAMISNLQTRINFLEEVLKSIENNKNIKNSNNEKTI